MEEWTSWDEDAPTSVKIEGGNGNVATHPEAEVAKLMSFPVSGCCLSSLPATPRLPQNSNHHRTGARAQRSAGSTGVRSWEGWAVAASGPGPELGHPALGPQLTQA